MRIPDGQLVLSPSDLSSFLSCRHKAGLDLARAHKVLERPRGDNPYAAILQKRGEEHEQAYVESLRAQGLTVVNARPEEKTPYEEQDRLTREAMAAGVDVIVQARLAAGDMAGYADVLRRVEKPSALGAWSYEAQDTKLALETKGGTILQLSAYSHMLEAMQGVRPENFQVVTPGLAEAGAPAVQTISYRLDDYAAYYRMVVTTFHAELAKGHERLREEYYPEPVEHCEVCAWAPMCEARRRKDDHLSYIAGCGRAQRVELVAQGVPTLKAAAEMTVPVTFTPARGARETYDRLGNQARVQDQQRTTGKPVVERLAVVEGEGLCRLPAPSKRDLFLDLEGARFAREGGREYLFGICGAVTADGAEAPSLHSQYHALWATNDAEEKAAFEEMMDLIMRAWDDDPQMHVYHFNHYEVTAFKKLVGRYVTRGEALDRLLRAERFVDLYPIVKQAVRAGVESYSIKKLEQYYGYTRAVDLANVWEPRVVIEAALEADPTAITGEIRTVVQGYNEDDCRSNQGLRDWLEQLRSEAEAAGEAVPRPEEKGKEGEKELKPLQQKAVDLREQLLTSIPLDASDPSHPDHPRWLLAYLVDWHKREVNAEWWEYFRLKELPEDELLDERKAVAGLQFVELVDVIRYKSGKPTGSVVHRYTYPPQDIDLKGRLQRQDGTDFGEIVAHDRQARLLDVKRGPKTAGLPHPTAAFAADVVGTDVQQASVIRLAERVIAGADECGAQLLMRQQPRLNTGPFQKAAGESEQDFAVRIATVLDKTTLPIQGPPGAGKTYIGAQMIRALVKAGKKVGVTATSHKAIANLLKEVGQDDGAKAPSLRLKLGCKPRDHDDVPDGVEIFDSNEAALDAVVGGKVDVFGGTSHLWAREEFAGTVDVLFVDEAGQMSLANVLAVSQAANSLVLLGDPQQLDQPEKAAHPDGVGVSALDHVLAGAQTMPEDRGIFLPVTWRMSPALTAFTSELFYEGKLHARPGLECQELKGRGTLDGSKLWLVPVDHDGNQSSSMEEVDAVAALVQRLLAPGSTWVNEKGVTVPLTADDIRIVAPFNAQVNRIAERLTVDGAALDFARARKAPSLLPTAPSLLGVEVGTVDKFQGQTCAVIIYSMATSRPEDAPRGMEFLYSLNRLNVATSRARCAVFVVASPRLFEPECRTPRQMKLANGLCRYVERATDFTGDGS